jgi:hypothetical protein
VLEEPLYHAIAMKDVSTRKLKNLFSESMFIEADAAAGVRLFFQVGGRHMYERKLIQNRLACGWRPASKHLRLLVSASLCICLRCLLCRGSCVRVSCAWPKRNSKHLPFENHAPPSVDTYDVVPCCPLNIVLPAPPSKPCWVLSRPPTWLRVTVKHTLVRAQTSIPEEIMEIYTRGMGTHGQPETGKGERRTHVDPSKSTSLYRRRGAGRLRLPVKLVRLADVLKTRAFSRLLKHVHACKAHVFIRVILFMFPEFRNRNIY